MRKIHISFDKEELPLEFFLHLGGEKLFVSRNLQYLGVSVVYLNICELYLVKWRVIAKQLLFEQTNNSFCVRSGFPPWKAFILLVYLCFVCERRL